MGTRSARREALTPEADSLHRAEPRQVGREAELVLAANQVLGAASSRAIVQGEYGVGKTSFVGRLRTALAGHGVLTHARPVRVTRDLRARSGSAYRSRAAASKPSGASCRCTRRSPARWSASASRRAARRTRAAACSYT